MRIKLLVPRHGWVEYDVISYNGVHHVNDFMSTTLEELDYLGLDWEYLK